MPKLIIPIGPSGSGKSTYIKNNFKPDVVVSPDNLRKKLTGDISNHTQESRVWSMVPTLLKQKLSKYGEAVLDATNVDSGDRSKILKLFGDGVEKIAIIFNASPEECKKRVNADIESGKDRSKVPDYIIDKQFEKFKNGYNNIEKQFDKVIYGNGGKFKVDIKEEIKIRKFIKSEINKIMHESFESDAETAKFQAYNDMYLIPQSNWKAKASNISMYDSKGGVKRPRLGEIHKLVRIEYDMFHTGEVITECDGETYSIDSKDFTESFEKIVDEEKLDVNNESIKNDIKKLSSIKEYYGKNILEVINRLEKKFL